MTGGPIGRCRRVGAIGALKLASGMLGLAVVLQERGVMARPVLRLVLVVIGGCERAAALLVLGTLAHRRDDRTAKARDP